MIAVVVAVDVVLLRVLLWVRILLVLLVLLLLVFMLVLLFLVQLFYRSYWNDRSSCCSIRRCFLSNDPVVAAAAILFVVFVVVPIGAVVLRFSYCCLCRDMLTGMVGLP